MLENQNTCDSVPKLKILYIARTSNSFVVEF